MNDIDLHQKMSALNIMSNSNKLKIIFLFLRVALFTDETYSTTRKPSYYILSSSIFKYQSNFINNKKEDADNEYKTVCNEEETNKSTTLIASSIKSTQIPTTILISSTIPSVIINTTSHLSTLIHNMTQTNTRFSSKKKPQKQLIENRTISFNLIAETTTNFNCDSDQTMLLVNYQNEIKQNVKSKK